MDIKRGFAPIIILVLLALGTLTYFGYKYSEFQKPSPEVLAPSPFIGTSKLCFDKLTKSEIRQTPIEIPAGTVSGTVYYPGESLPEGLKVCAYNLIGQSRYCTEDFSNQNRIYKLKLSAGKYYVYSLTKEGNLIGAGEPNKVNDYQVHNFDSGEQIGVSPLIVTVEADSKINNVDVGDDIIASEQFYDELFCPDL